MNRLAEKEGGLCRVTIYNVYVNTAGRGTRLRTAKTYFLFQETPLSLPPRSQNRVKSFPCTLNFGKTVIIYAHKQAFLLVSNR